ncbi:uncharacterized protein LOC123561438 [Mercenaria mercenaria]|uniref:uncharacterized protein LOC123561438 n=1 Tax=Mercenaria mercenaria TaxID=6596 RepID=UPI00234E52D6|nr:uncharacterized protein LOC123561438 [Mercenaria mercenaria]
MDDLKTVVTLVSACLFLAAQCSGQCDDIDTQACSLMAAQNPNLCNDPNLSNTACPKYCNKCPLICYHCDTSVRNYTDCNTTRTCQIGEQCLLHQLVSSKDGHREYKMNCASLDVCDGKGIMQSERRSLKSRNLVTQCCSSDLCNYPTSVVTAGTPSPSSSATKAGTPLPSSSATKAGTPLPSSSATQATTSSFPHCNRDIEVLIEDSKDTSSSPYIIQYLKDLVSQIDIGLHHNQIGLALYEHDVEKQFDLDQHTDKVALLNAINRIDFQHTDNDIDKGDVIEFLQHQLRKGHHGDRSNYEDVVIIMADHFHHKRSTRYLLDQPAHHTVDLSSISKDVIVINVGANGAHSVLSSLASDASHVIDVPNYSTLTTTLPRVLSLLCV